MKKTVLELRQNRRVQAIRGKSTAPNETLSLRENISFEHGKNCPECRYCRAMLPRDVKFQKMHMLQSHGDIIWVMKKKPTLK
jgi:hypothetical protein